MALRRDLITSALAVLVLTLLCGILFPLVITGISQIALPGNANGQLVYRHGQLIGSDLIGQQFATPVLRNGRPVLDKRGNPVMVPDPRYFQTRPSATVPPDNAAATTFSNLGPNSVATKRELTSNIAAYIKLNGRYYPGGLTPAKVPVDAADSSASGIDPDISIANARIQAHRIATVRHLPLATVDRLIAIDTGGRGLGFVGNRTVNVLELNLALNRVSGGHR
ncbi:MAG TPA: potassium-transporting ATPase subunit C [Solirubrobacteraceae bacterium]|jgi:K+-transporting ATPase ATPase C chain|nr:potassium-transporting ATPase subunit C [Solirubrobacteraceae bacterium]